MIRPDAVRDSEKRKEDIRKPTLFEVLRHDQDLAELALKMLEPDPFARITIGKVLEHPFVRGCFRFVIVLAH